MDGLLTVSWAGLVVRFGFNPLARLHVFNLFNVPFLQLAHRFHFLNFYWDDYISISHNLHISPFSVAYLYKLALFLREPKNRAIKSPKSHTPQTIENEPVERTPYTPLIPSQTLSSQVRFLLSELRKWSRRLWCRILLDFLRLIPRKAPLLWFGG